MEALAYKAISVFFESKQGKNKFLCQYLSELKKIL